jgi:hypothetical protein
VLSKAIRCDEHDRQQILEIHKSVVIEFNILVQRFIDELHPYAIGHEDTRRDYFLTVVRDLFGELKRGEAARIMSVSSVSDGRVSTISDGFPFPLPALL